MPPRLMVDYPRDSGGQDAVDEMASLKFLSSEFHLYADESETIDFADFRSLLASAGVNADPNVMLQIMDMVAPKHGGQVKLEDIALFLQHARSLRLFHEEMQDEKLMRKWLGMIGNVYNAVLFIAFVAFVMVLANDHENKIALPIVAMLGVLLLLSICIGIVCPLCRMRWRRWVDFVETNCEEYRNDTAPCADDCALYTIRHQLPNDVKSTLVNSRRNDEFCDLSSALTRPHSWRVAPDLCSTRGKPRARPTSAPSRVASSSHSSRGKLRIRPASASIARQYSRTMRSSVVTQREARLAAVSTVPESVDHHAESSALPGRHSHTRPASARYTASSTRPTMRPTSASHLTRRTLPVEQQDAHGARTNRSRDNHHHPCFASRSSTAVCATHNDWGSRAGESKKFSPHALPDSGRVNTSHRSVEAKTNAYSTAGKGRAEIGMHGHKNARNQEVEWFAYDPEQYERARKLMEANTATHAFNSFCYNARASGLKIRAPDPDDDSIADSGSSETLA
eukprot:GEMP01028228.1.p1 GENE.GEMP01028228.1~~GEMP01028228.1.p1  ORF type:complete len:510 (+),score=76.29 GEMP01028228.1:367-1896(+)